MGFAEIKRRGYQDKGSGEISRLRPPQRAFIAFLSIKTSGQWFSMDSGEIVGFGPLKAGSAKKGMDSGARDRMATDNMARRQFLKSFIAEA